MLNNVLNDYINSFIAESSKYEYIDEFKIYIIEEIAQRVNEIEYAGLKDEKVMNDLILSEYNDLHKNYRNFEETTINEIKKKKSKKIHLFGTIFYVPFVLIIYLISSLYTQNWHLSWVFLVNSFLMLFAYYGILVVSLLTKAEKSFHPISRIILAVTVFLFATAIFLVLLILFEVPHAWLVFIVAVIVMMTADSIYIQYIKERFAVLFQLLYVVPIAAMIYVILFVLGIIPAHPGWIIIPASLFFDIIGIGVQLKHHKNFKRKELEADAQWEEN